MKPLQATGSTAGWRHIAQEPKGRNASRERILDLEPQSERRRLRSKLVKSAREVLRLLWEEGMLVVRGV